VTDLVIGYGEVGRALEEVLKERYEVVIHDPPKERLAPEGKYEFMHVCVPYTDSFVKTVDFYMKQFAAEHVVIHSTLPVGTTRALSYLYHVTYSPVRGEHPELVRYLRQFPKWIATTDNENEVLSHFQACGMSMRLAPSIEALEWFKLLETFEYAYRIVLWQEFERQADRREVRGGATKNEVLSALKQWFFEKRAVYKGERGLVPIMFGGVIKGHCLLPNIELLKPLLTPELHEWVTKSNRLKKEKTE
jgi:hypothetical protein